MSAGIALALLQSRAGGLHVEDDLGFVAGGSVGDAAIDRLRARQCPRAAFSMIHAAPTSGRIFIGTSLAR